jgi:Protein of unknown function (DUF5818)
MTRTSNVIAFVLFAGALFAVGQDGPLASPFPEDAIAPRELIAWSRVQKPQPAPQPLPPPDTAVPQPDQDSKAPADPQGQQAPSQNSEPAVQSFVGKIVKDGATYILKVSGSATYQLEGAENAKEYEDKNVKIVGSLERGGSTIHVVKIELLS